MLRLEVTEEGEGQQMDRRQFLIGAAASSAALKVLPAAAQDVPVLRFHSMVPVQAPMAAEVIAPWATALELASGSRLKIELYGSMALGGSPQSLFDQTKDGVVDMTQTVVGYTPGRFPKTETFELPFLMTNGAETSVALQRFVEQNSMDEFAGIKLLAMNTHGPGLIHVNRPVEKLEDLAGLKIRGGSQIINEMLANLGAEPIALPVTQLGEALTTGVIDGTTLPWDITPTLRLSELVKHHVEFGGRRGLYTQAFVFVMNQASYDGLAEDIRAAIDQTTGVEMSRAMGAVADKGDAYGRKVAQDLGNSIVTLDEAETARWVAAVQPAIEAWHERATALGLDSRALQAAATALVDEAAAEARG